MKARSRLLNLSRVIALLALAVPSLVSAQSTPALLIGETHEIESSILGETRTYLIDKPSDYDLSEDAYPIVVLLDGETQFRHVSSTAALLAENDRIPEVLVVGVVNTDRRRDMNPPDPGYDDSRAERFLGFIADELLPQVEREYRTRPHRVLIGHSSAGIFGVYSLLRSPDAFDGLVLIAPSFGDHRSIVTEVRPFLNAHQDLQKDIFVTMANEGGRQLGGAWELSAILEEEAPAGVRWEFRRYPDEDHGSVPLPSVYDGLQAMYGGWYLQDPIQTYEMGGMPAIERHYAALSERMKYMVPVPESVLIDTFNSLLVRLSGQPDKTEAEAVIEKALGLYPESPLVHFYAGRFYGSTSDKQRAIDHLTRSLVLDPGFGAARRMLSAYGADVAAIAPDPE